MVSRALYLVLPLMGVTALSAVASEMLPKDVHSGHWAAEATRKAFDYGIFKGFPDGTFRGDAPLSGYQAAVVAGRIMDQVGKNRVIEEFAQRTDLEDTEKHYATVVAQARLDQDSLKSEIDSLRAELDSLKSKRNRVEVEEKVILDTSPDAAKYLEKLKNPSTSSRDKAKSGEDLGSAMEMERDIALSRPKEKPMPSMKGEDSGKKAELKMPTEKKDKSFSLWAGGGMTAPTGDADPGFTWSVGWNFAPTSQRALTLDYTSAAGLEVGPGVEADLTTIAATYLLKNPTKASRLGYGLGLSMIKNSVSSPLVSGEETDLGYHATLQYLLSNRFLAEFRYTMGGTDLQLGGATAGGDAMSLKLMTGGF